jgi:hypothetical protein
VTENGENIVQISFRVSARVRDAFVDALRMRERGAARSVQGHLSRYVLRYISGKSEVSTPTESHTVPTPDHRVEGRTTQENLYSGFTVYSRSEQRWHDMLQDVLTGGHHQSIITAQNAIKLAHDVSRATRGELKKDEIDRSSRDRILADAESAAREAEDYLRTHNGSVDEPHGGLPPRKQPV